MSSRFYIGMLLALAACEKGKNTKESQHHVPDVQPSTLPSIVPSTATVSALGDAALQVDAQADASLADERRASCEKISIDLTPFKDDEEHNQIPDIVDAGALDNLFNKMVRLIRGRANDHVRIGVYGDSNMTMDWITGSMRLHMQTSFGEGGHGFVAVGRPWAWYIHQYVQHDLNNNGWKSYAVSTHQIGDEAYGISGIAAASKYAGAKAWVATVNKEDSPIGKSAGKFGVFYLKQPFGGSFEIRVDGKPSDVVDAKSEKMASAYRELELEEGPHRVELVVKSAWPVRLLGTILERKKPGIIVDSYGVGALSAEALARERSEINRQMLEQRKLDAVFFLVGTNMFAPVQHPIWMKEVLENHRKALPNLSIMLMSPPDMSRDGGQTSESRIIKVGEQLKQIAKDNRTAFFDFRAAMGGEGAIGRFAKKGLAWRDYIHLSEKGGALMGKRVARALLTAFQKFLDAHPQAGCENS